MSPDVDITFSFIFSTFLTRLFTDGLKLNIRFPSDAFRPSWDIFRRQGT